MVGDHDDRGLAGVMIITDRRIRAVVIGRGESGARNTLLADSNLVAPLAGDFPECSAEVFSA